MPVAVAAVTLSAPCASALRISQWRLGLEPAAFRGPRRGARSREADRDADADAVALRPLEPAAGRWPAGIRVTVPIAWPVGRLPVVTMIAGPGGLRRVPGASSQKLATSVSLLDCGNENQKKLFRCAVGPQRHPNPPAVLSACSGWVVPVNF